MQQEVFCLIWIKRKVFKLKNFAFNQLGLALQTYSYFSYGTLSDIPDAAAGVVAFAADARPSRPCSGTGRTRLDTVSGGLCAESPD